MFQYLNWWNQISFCECWAPFKISLADRWISPLTVSLLYLRTRLQKKYCCSDKIKVYVSLDNCWTYLWITLQINWICDACKWYWKNEDQKCDIWQISKLSHLNIKLSTLKWDLVDRCCKIYSWHWQNDDLNLNKFWLYSLQNN